MWRTGRGQEIRTILKPNTGLRYRDYIDKYLIPAIGAVPCSMGGMGRLMVAVDPAVGVTPEALVAQSGRDEETAAVGEAQVEKAANGATLPGLLELTVVPLAVHLTSSILYDMERGSIVRSGIAAFPPRLERILETGLSAPTVDRPDNWYAVPDALRLAAR